MAQAMRPPAAPGRGAGLNPPNRFEPVELEVDTEWLDAEWAEQPGPRKVVTRYYEDRSRSVLSRNDSPDVGFTYSVNAYRGCEHGCIYCYARPTHEYLGYSAGLDFESRIWVKLAAPALLDKALGARSWQPQPVALSGNTDGYQPVERRYGLTRQLLEVFLAHRNPVVIVTKSALIRRDLDLLAELARRRLVAVTVSITTLDDALQKVMEPRAAPPARRLETVAALAEAGVPVGVNVAPVVPGLTDHELPAILDAAARHGAERAMYLLLRLPHAVKDLFLEWLRRHYPERGRRVANAVREVRGGRLNDTRWGLRMSGEGLRAEALGQLFDIHCRRLGLNRGHVALDTSGFRRRVSPQTELELE